MIEIDSGAPILLRVAVVAGGVEILPVRTGCAMTADAIGTQLLGGRIRGMTDMAIQFGVYSHQRKLGLRKVIVLDGLPDFVVMAVGALGAKAPRVRIICPVAAVAVFWDFVLVHPGAVAAKAI